MSNTIQLTANINPSNASVQHGIWTSDDNNIASVSTTGLVTARNPGSTTVKFTSHENNKVGTSTIHVTLGAGGLNVTAIQLSENYLAFDSYLFKQEYPNGYPMTVTILPATATNRGYSVYADSNDEIVTVTDHGNGNISIFIEEGREGIAIVNAVSHNGGLYAQCFVHISMGP